MRFGYCKAGSLAAFVLGFIALLSACDKFHTSPTEPRAQCVLPAPPAMVFTSVPAIGSSDHVKGTVTFQNSPCDAQNYRVALYVSFDGVGGICKPYESTPLTMIDEKGRWESAYDTGGVDDQAPWIFALLVTKDFTDSCFTSSIPQVDGVKVLARISQNRTH